MSTTIVGAKMVAAILFINEWKCRGVGGRWIYSGFSCFLGSFVASSFIVFWDFSISEFLVLC